MASHGERILGMALFFGLIVSFLVGSWKHGHAVVIAAAVTGAFAGQWWHEWRTQCERDLQKSIGASSNYQNPSKISQK